MVSQSTARRYELQDPDVRLMLEVRDGSAAAFDALMTRYQSRLVTVLGHLTGRRDLAEDLSQEVFLRVYRARERYVPGAKFSTWLYTIANNVASNALTVAGPAARGAGTATRSERRVGPIRSTNWPWPPVACCRHRQVVDAGAVRNVVQEGAGPTQFAAADGGAIEQVRGYELRRHCRDDGKKSAGD